MIVICHEDVAVNNKLVIAGIKTNIDADSNAVYMTAYDRKSYQTYIYADMKNHKIKSYDKMIWKNDNISIIMPISISDDLFSRNVDIEEIGTSDDTRVILITPKHEESFIIVKHDDGDATFYDMKSSIRKNGKFDKLISA